MLGRFGYVWRLSAVFALFPPLAGLRCFACLRPILDERAVQWSTFIVEAQLESIGPKIALPASVQDKKAFASGSAVAPATEPADNSRPATAFRIYTFHVTQVLDGNVFYGKAVRVVRLMSYDAPASPCPATLRGRGVGDRFILLLRRIERTRLAAPASKVLEDDSSGAAAIVYLLNRSEVDAGALDDLKSLIKDVRQSEATATDAQIAAQTTALAVAQDDTESDESEKALLKIGPRVLRTVRAKLEDSTVNDAGKTRLKHVIAELTPPPLSAEAGD